MPAPRRTRLLFVGAFPPAGSPAFGGNITDCRTLLSSSFAKELDLVLLDSTAAAGRRGPLARARASISRLLRFVFLLRRTRPDVVLLFASGELSFLEKSSMVAIARSLGVPSLLSIRSGHFLDGVDRSRVFRTLAYALVRLPHSLLCQGLTWQAFFRDRFAMGPDRCPILESWVATPELIDVGAVRSYEDRKPLTILFLGALETFKGIFELLEATRALSSDSALPPFQLTFAGEGSSRPAAEAWGRSHRLEHIVRWAGALYGRDKVDALACADVFVLPSHTEGLPNAMIEAMATGVPVVVSSVGSVPDVITDGVNGLLVAPHDANALADAMRRLLSSASLRAALGKAGRATATERFGSEAAARRLVHLVARAAEVAHHS